MEAAAKLFGHPFAQFGIAFVAIFAGAVLVIRLHAVLAVGLAGLVIGGVFFSLALWQTVNATMLVKIGLVVIVGGLCVCGAQLLLPESSKTDRSAASASENAAPIGERIEPQVQILTTPETWIDGNPAPSRYRLMDIDHVPAVWNQPFEGSGIAMVTQVPGSAWQIPVQPSGHKVQRVLRITIVSDGTQPLRHVLGLITLRFHKACRQRGEPKSALRPDPTIECISIASFRLDRMDAGLQNAYEFFLTNSSRDFVEFFLPDHIECEVVGSPNVVRVGASAPTRFDNWLSPGHMLERGDVAVKPKGTF